MSETETTSAVCPRCWGWAPRVPCVVCNGKGFKFNSLASHRKACSACKGEGTAQIDCLLCEGTGGITIELMKLYEAHIHVSINDPDWDGNDASKPGITIYSLAAWYRRRESFGPVKFLEAYVGGGTQHIKIWDSAQSHLGRRTFYAFYGLAWGYWGTGPTGLATILADISEEFTFEEARGYVASLGGLDWDLIIKPRSADVQVEPSV